MAYITDKNDNLVEVIRTVPAENFMASIAVNIDNDKLSDEEFREFIRNTLPIVQYEGVENNGTIVR